MIKTLQKQLTKIYALTHSPDISRFLIDSKTWSERYQGNQKNLFAQEQILIQQTDQDEDLWLGLYLNDQVLSNLNENHPEDELGEHNFADFCTVIEAVSHFLLVSHRTEKDLPLSALELELQAEIDKFVTSFIYRYYHEQSTHITSDLQDALFDQFQLDPHLDTHELNRYRLASHSAARLCRFLSRKFLKKSPQWPALFAFLRKFYRLGLNAKFATICAQAP